MTKREVAALICKALAIYSFIEALNLVSSVYQFIVLAVETKPSGLSLLTSAVTYTSPVIFSMLAGFYLWFCADEVAGLMVKQPSTGTDIPTEPLVIGPEAQTLVFSGMGLYTLMQAIPGLVQHLCDYVIATMQQAPDVVLQVYTNPVGERVSLGIQLALGIWLLFGASGLIKLLKALRATAGR